MYEKILVPLDCSELAEMALPYAEELAVRLGSEVTLLCVREPADIHSPRLYECYLQDVVRRTKEEAVKGLGKLTAKEIEVKPVVLSGDPAETIVDYADKEKSGLVIMVTHGRSGVGRWLVGSVADKVIRATQQPVALIRATGVRPVVQKKGILKNMLVPLDGSKTGETALPYAEELATRLKAGITLLRVFDPGYWTSHMALVEQVESMRASARDYIEKMAAQLQKKGIAAKAEFQQARTTDVAEEIIRVADEISADLVVMSTHGESGVSRWVFGSVAERVLKGGSTPLMLVRALS